MRPELRMLGISPELKGTGIMEQMLYGTISYNSLSYREIQEVLYAWETRNYVPVKVLEEGNVDRVSPSITKEDVANGIRTQEEYDRDYVRMIEAYITIWV